MFPYHWVYKLFGDTFNLRENGDLFDDIDKDLENLSYVMASFNFTQKCYLEVSKLLQNLKDTY